MWEGVCIVAVQDNFLNFFFKYMDLKAHSEEELI